MKKIILASSLCLATSVAAAAPEKNDGPSLAPHESVVASVQAFRRNDVRSLIRLSVGDEAFAELRRQWDIERRQKPDPTENAQFQGFVALLTAPNAEDALMAQIDPKLDEMRPQMQMVVGMFGAMAQAGLQQDPSLSPEERDRAARLLEGLSQLLLQNDLTSRESAQKSVGILCEAARSLDVRSLDDLYELSFDQLCGKGDVVLGAAKEVLDIYGLELDTWLDSVKAETVENDGTTALVRVSYEIFGVRESVDTEMVLVGKRWLGAEAAEMAAQHGAK